MRLVLGLVASLSLATSSLYAASVPPTFSSAVELVEVAVTVRDESGEIVSNLSAEDFMVVEDGQPQKVDLFARAVDPIEPPNDGGGSGTSPRRSLDLALSESALAMNLGLLLDTSSSMFRERSLSQQAAIRFLESVPRARELTTLFFDHDIRISRYDNEHQQGLFERILETQAGERTAFYDAVTVYLSRVADSRGRKVAVLFTDGVDTSSTVTFGELLDMVRASSVVIYAIGFKGSNSSSSGSAHPMSGDGALKRLCMVSGGKAFFPRSYKDLPEIYERILADLAGQYVLGFTSTNPLANGKYRKLRVTVARPGLKVQHREGYRAPLAPQSALK